MRRIPQGAAARRVLRRAHPAPLHADLALVTAWKADSQGNLAYRRTTRDFAPMMATAARTTIAEAEQIVEPGALDPDLVRAPGIFVQRVVGERASRSASRSAPSRAAARASHPTRCASGS